VDIDAGVNAFVMTRIVRITATAHHCIISQSTPAGNTVCVKKVAPLPNLILSVPFNYLIAGRRFRVVRLAVRQFSVNIYRIPRLPTIIGGGMIKRQRQNPVLVTHIVRPSGVTV